ncbi:MAG: hypothetical protein A2017_11975 [Lentisphaerae bacterium GWF2_44_16]|nr:MAG: hypothetical protein A2017_11975 [Lentisphaerae bacterium GWF2_44_16]
MSVNAIGSIVGNIAESDSSSNDYLEKLATKIIEQRDKNGDGALDTEEAMLPKEVFSIMDSNGDGKIDMKELANQTSDIKKALNSVTKSLSNVDKISAEGKFNDLMIQSKANKNQ